MPDDLRVSIVNAPGDASYPISGYTYILVYKEQTDAAKGKALVDFLWWGIHDGREVCQGPALRATAGGRGDEGGGQDQVDHLPG